MQETWWIFGQLRRLGRPIVLPLIAASVDAEGVTPAYSFSKLLRIDTLLSDKGVRDSESLREMDRALLVLDLAGFRILDEMDHRLLAE